jgi:hypothetical protein
MKTLKIILLIMIVSLFSNSLIAQVSVGINIGVPAPRYYYLQDIESYYDNQTSMYIYLSGSRWIHARSLPPSFGYYDFNNSHRVIIRDYNGTRPYNYFRTHKTNFPKGRYISPEKNYWSVKEHKVQGNKNRVEDNSYRQQMRNDSKAYKNEGKRNNPGNGNQGNGRGKGQGNGNGKGHKK